MPSAAFAACIPCADHQPGIAWGMVTATPIGEASGLAASRRNPGVLWTHNDGSRERVYALSTNGTLLAIYNFNENVDDLEDVAVGPGPLAGVSYLYIGDIGGNAGATTVRNQIKIVRVPEPRVDPALPGDPPTIGLSGTETFTLVYPDGSYDAEALLIDPVLLDLVVVIKDTFTTRIYRTNIASVTNHATLVLEYVGSITFTDVSGGTVAPDGGGIMLRRENGAFLWARCDDEPLANAFARAPQPIPVIGPPTEPNGEAITFATAGSGYLTISEGSQPLIYFFESRCVAPPFFTLGLQAQTGFLGGEARFDSMATGYPGAAYSWRFNGELIPGQTGPALVLQNLTLANAGTYEVTASNPHDSVTSTGTLTVRSKPDLRITEAFSDPAPSPAVRSSDWWELTSFETQPVNLSGWRFNDSLGGLTDPFTFPAGITISPRESIVFVDSLTPAEFRAWWGATNVPPSVQIVSYAGGGLGLGAGGDGLRLWNSATMDVADTVASVDFGAADVGISFNYNPITGQFGPKSQLGVNGVIRAAGTADIGSPGRIVAPAAPPLLEAVLVGEILHISFDAAVGHRYSLQARDNLRDESWIPTGDSFTATNNFRASFEKSATAGQRFYRVVVD